MQPLFNTLYPAVTREKAALFSDALRARDCAAKLRKSRDAQQRLEDWTQAQIEGFGVDWRNGGTVVPPPSSPTGERGGGELEARLKRRKRRVGEARMGPASRVGGDALRALGGDVGAELKEGAVARSVLASSPPVLRSTKVDEEPAPRWLKRRAGDAKVVAEPPSADLAPAAPPSSPSVFQSTEDDEEPLPKRVKRQVRDGDARKVPKAGFDIQAFCALSKHNEADPTAGALLDAVRALGEKPTAGDILDIVRALGQVGGGDAR
ncbi:hypothetical protein V500_10587, partial [Pseudogymnoascus sp. VKM F-4518 (FW-2643)]